MDYTKQMFIVMLQITPWNLMASELPDVQTKLGAAARERKLGLPVQNCKDAQHSFTQPLSFIKLFDLIFKAMLDYK